MPKVVVAALVVRLLELLPCPLGLVDIIDPKAYLGHPPGQQAGSKPGA